MKAKRRPLRLLVFRHRRHHRIADLFRHFRGDRPKSGGAMGQPGCCRREFGMKWRVTLELVGPDGIVGVHEVGGRATVLGEAAPQRSPLPAVDVVVRHGRGPRAALYPMSMCGDLPTEAQPGCRDHAGPMHAGVGVRVDHNTRCDPVGYFECRRASAGYRPPVPDRSGPVLLYHARNDKIHRIAGRQKAVRRISDVAPV
jgi:hypothetical protein